MQVKRPRIGGQRERERTPRLALMRSAAATQISGTTSVACGRIHENIKVRASELLHRFTRHQGTWNRLELFIPTIKTRDQSPHCKTRRGRSDTQISEKKAAGTRMRLTPLRPAALKKLFLPRQLSPFSRLTHCTFLCDSGFR